MNKSKIESGYDYKNYSARDLLIASGITEQEIDSDGFPEPRKEMNGVDIWLDKDIIAWAEIHHPEWMSRRRNEMPGAKA